MTPVAKNLSEKRLQWYGNVNRREVGHCQKQCQMHRYHERHREKETEKTCGKTCVHLYYNSPEICLSVTVRKLQAVVLARSFREISQNARIDCRSFLSCICISVRPSKFVKKAKNHKNECKNRVFR